MNATDWLNYWQAQQKPEGRKADWLDSAGTALGAGIGFLAGGPPGAMAGASLGGAAGGTAENAANGGVTLQDLMRLGMAAGPVAMPFNLGFAAGGAVPDVTDPMFQQAAFGPPPQQQAATPQGPVIRTPQDVADFMRGLEASMGAMPGGTFTPEAPKHPTLEMLASVVPDVVKALPAPRQTNSVNKTLGAWLPAAATTFSAPINYGKAQREERNKKGSEAAKALADHRWSVARSLVDSLDTQRGMANTINPEHKPTGEDQPVPADVLAAYGNPKGVKTYRELSAWKSSPDAPKQDAAGQLGETDATDIAKALVEYRLPPPNQRSLYTRDGLRIAKAFNKISGGGSLVSLANRFQAEQAWVRARNNGPQLRILQNSNAVEHMMDNVDVLTNDLQKSLPLAKGRYKTVNKAFMRAAKEGIYGPETAAKAQALEAAINDAAGELGSVIMNGNTPTDNALRMAKSNLEGDWSAEVLHKMTKLAKQNIQFRRMAMNVPVQGSMLWGQEQQFQDGNGGFFDQIGVGGN